MRILLDTCVWGLAKVELIRLGHDVEWSGDWAADPGDEEILRIAGEQGRVLVTLDKDFGQLAMVERVPHAGIVRLVGFRSIRQAQAIHDVLERCAQELNLGAIVTAEPGRLRIRPADAE